MTVATGASTLSSVNALAELPANDLDVLSKYVEVESYPPGTTLLEEGKLDRDMFFLLSGQCRLYRDQVDIGRVPSGTVLGELGLIAGRPRSATVRAETDIDVARMRHAAYWKLASAHTATALRLNEAILGLEGARLATMDDRVSMLLSQRAQPRRLHVYANVDGQVLEVPTGTLVGQLLPQFVEGVLVVAGLLDNKLFSLASPMTANGRVEPLTVAHWEGERILRGSVALLLLEAAARLAPTRKVRLGPPVENVQWFDLDGPEAMDRAQLARDLESMMRELAGQQIPFRQEYWMLEEAITWFDEHGDPGTARLLRTSRDNTVQLVSSGNAYVLGLTPFLPHAGLITDFAVSPDHAGLVLVTGTPARPASSAVSSPFIAYGTMLAEHQSWLQKLGVHTVGDFNVSCIDGEVRHIIRVAEGFHEKKLSRLADDIANRHGTRLVCVAGPSSSGKTTFIKRLRVQLQVNGLAPVLLSLDDYYLDRERTARDASGAYDFEALEALDLALLSDHLTRLLRGETVRTARYDFTTGRSLPEGGAEITMGADTVLLLEGIHGLNPRLLQNTVEASQLYRIFVQPMTSLPLDRLTRVDLSDMRLLRRIVRDRHGRNCTAADNITRWPSVRQGERKHILPHIGEADAIFDTSLIYELSVLKVFAERYLLEVPQTHPSFATAHRLRRLLDRFVAIYPDHVPPTSIIREFIGGSGFEY